MIDWSNLAALDRGDHAGRNADRDREDHGAERQFQRRREQREELLPAPAAW
jgi:hypothetical protein